MISLSFTISPLSSDKLPCLLNGWHLRIYVGYNILCHVNSLANDLIGPSIPHPALAPAPGLTILSLPPQCKFTSSHICDNLVDCPHLEKYNTMLKPLVHPASIDCDVNWPAPGPWELTTACPSLMPKMVWIMNHDSSGSICWMFMHCFIKMVPRSITSPRRPLMKS